MSIINKMFSSFSEKKNIHNDDNDDNRDNDDKLDFIHSNEKIWNIIESYFKDKHLEQLVRHQIESYNNFIDYQIFKTIQMFNPLHIVSEQDYDAKNEKYSLEIFITFTNFNIYRPQIHENNGAIKLMFPQEARLRNFTYSSIMTIDINIKYLIRSGSDLSNERTINKVIPKINIGRIPIMLKSNICILKQYKHVDSNYTGECKYDAGGYFIINGSEKIVLGQEKIAENKIYVFNSTKNTKYSYIAEIKSVPDFKCISPKKITMMISSKDNGFGFPITVLFPRIKQPIPLFIVFRALGIISDKNICEIIILNVEEKKNKLLLETLKASIVDANNYLTKDDCFKYVNSQAMYTPINMDKEVGAKKKIEFTNDILNNDLFPHCHNISEKIYFMGYMANKLIQTFLKLKTPDDRDSYLNKRIDMCGVLLNNLFRNYFNKLVKDMEKQIIREINTGSWKSTEDYINIISKSNINKIIKSSTIELGLKKALSTGDFSIKHSNSTKVGVAQVLTRLTYISAISHLRRIATPTDKSGKIIPPRKLHNTSWGFLCPAETPEGQSVGIVKNLSYMTHVTIYSNVEPLYDYVNPHIINFENIKPCELFNKVKVIINGCWVGIAKQPYELYCDLKNKKYCGIINIYTSIIFDINNKEIKICNDSGRLTRPVFRVRDNNILVNKKIIHSLNSRELEWNDLLLCNKIDNSVIEYIDPEEQSFSMISMTIKELNKKTDNDNNICYKYTHCEIHPSTIFGVAASCIPFPDYNQSPRNTYQSAQSKQALGIYASNYHERMDKTSYILTYAERPLVETRVMNILRINELPAGCNIIVAIMTHTGYNQEDSVLINKGSIDRGLFLASIFHTEKDEDKQKINGDEEIRCKPNPSKTKGMKVANYNKVNNKGIIPENTLVENRDIIISKIVPIKENRNDHTKIIKYEDQSKIYRTTEETYVDKNYIDRNGDGYNFCKVRLRTLRKPVIGDKFSSRAGQKNTCGNIIPEEDMPFTSSGVRPDFIINPHAIPSRMTMAQLKEMILCKVLLSLGLFGDGTSFGDLSVKSICDELLKCGFDMYGNELLYSGLTGEQHECSVFMGPCFYQRLKHMVVDKQHSRSYGPPVSFTRQPAEGRSRDGGLRIGEMERDAIISHGASQFLRSRFYDCSDKYEIYVCRKCGMMATCNNELHIYKCHTCENRTDFAHVQIPYSAKLLFHELQTMNIVPRLLCS